MCFFLFSTCKRPFNPISRLHGFHRCRDGFFEYLAFAGNSTIFTRCFSAHMPIFLWKNRYNLNILIKPCISLCRCTLSHAQSPHAFLQDIAAVLLGVSPFHASLLKNLPYCRKTHKSERSVSAKMICYIQQKELNLDRQSCLSTYSKPLQRRKHHVSCCSCPDYYFCWYVFDPQQHIHHVFGFVRLRLRLPLTTSYSFFLSCAAPRYHNVPGRTILHKKCAVHHCRTAHFLYFFFRFLFALPPCSFCATM